MFSFIIHFVVVINDKVFLMKRNYTKTLLRIINLSILLILNFIANAQYHYMGAYYNDGTPKYLVIPGDTVGVTFRANISATLPEYRSVPVYNPQLIADGRTETIGVKCPSDIWVTFVDEGAAYQNVLGYYTFPTDTPLVVPPPANKINIIFPNASKSGFGGGLNPGDKVYLGNFPPNTSIGFVLLANGWSGITQTVSSGYWILYSDSRFNPEADSTLKKHTVMLHDTASGRIVIGFEDMRRDGYGSDQDFNDVLFFATVLPVPCIDKLDSIPDLTSDGHISYSGNSGGLESKSLGDALTNRVYHKAFNNQLGEINYDHFQQINTAARPRTFGAGTGALKLSDMMPTSIPDSGVVGYITTPTDITSITNAVDVSSIDFTFKQQCRAAAFATQTLGVMYDHTKPICDRLKGAQLLSMSNFTLSNLNFVRYTLLQSDGNIEYSMSFSIGKKAGRNNFSFQSNWLNADYIAEDTLYNYQVWGAAPYYCIDMALEILAKFNAIMPIQQLKTSAALPSTYIVSGNRDGMSLNFSIKNNTNNNNGYFLIEDRNNESSATTSKRTVPFTIAANAISAITVPVNDALESTLSLYINNQLEDVVFMSDGVWGSDFNSANATMQKFTVTNDTIARNNSAFELHLLRNVQISAVTSDFISVYKLLKGGGVPQDLTGFKTLRFTASGAKTNLRVYLIKNSITNFSDQYYYLLPLSADAKDYTISINDFISAANKNNIDLKDIVQIVFAFEVTGGATINLNGAIANVLFSKQLIDYYNRADAGEVQTFPNPTAGQFTASIKSDTDAILTLRIIDPATGQIISAATVNAIKGINNIPVSITQKGSHMYVLTIQGDSIQYQVKKILVDKH